MQPQQRGQYNNVLANDTYLVAIVKRLYYMIFGRWIFWANLYKASFILCFPNQNIFNHLKAFKGQDNPQMITTTEILGW
jgi:hypothetical protein